MKYKVLMYCGAFVDETQLGDGIYGTDRPTLHLPDTTIAGLVDKRNATWHFVTGKNMPEGYTRNLSSCQLVDVTLQIEKQ